MRKDDRIKAAVLAQAKELGFALCRVAKCVAPPHVREFKEWLEQGRAGEMQWMGRNLDRRINPDLVLPGARSVIVLAMNYFTQPAGDPSPVFPRIARYAQGGDYHDVIGDRLRILDGFLKNHGGEQKCYVDTGPVLERDFAAKAGAGWHGKSTMLIHPELGAWFFLSEILTTLEFEPDEPQSERCGKCTRCIEACPTGAITAPHQLDSRRCISYLTIELKGSIPVELRPLIGNRIYGCDDCLAACPWNRFAQASRESAFAARHATVGMGLRDYLDLTGDQFRELFRDSPVKRTKRRGFLRNVCVALGNTGGPEDLPALERAAHDPEPLIAEHAQWAIQRITFNPKRAVEELNGGNTTG